jgi:hypothetical protein
VVALCKCHLKKIDLVKVIIIATVIIT